MAIDLDTLRKAVKGANPTGAKPPPPPPETATKGSGRSDDSTALTKNEEVGGCLGCLGVVVIVVGALYVYPKLDFFDWLGGCFIWAFFVSAAITLIQRFVNFLRSP